MNRSMAFFAHAAFVTAGRAGRCGGINDQNGCHGAPCAIQRRIRSISCCRETRLARIRRRHALRVRGRCDPPQDFGFATAGAVAEVETQVGLTIRRVGAVAGKTMLGKDWADVPVETNVLGCGGAGSHNGRKSANSPRVGHPLVKANIYSVLRIRPTLREDSFVRPQYPARSFVFQSRWRTC